MLPRENILWPTETAIRAIWGGPVVREKKKTYFKNSINVFSCLKGNKGPLSFMCLKYKSPINDEIGKLLYN